MLQWDYKTVLLTMEVGESFFIPTLDATATANTVRKFAEMTGTKIACRQALCEGAYGVRVWRVNDEPLDLHPDE